MIKWKVGKYAKDIISRGFRITFEVPPLNKDEWVSLYNNHKVNGWIARIRKKTLTSNKIMGYLTMEMISKRENRGNSFSVSKSEKGSVGINYAASSMSTRLSDLPCPAFNHRLLISDHRIVPEKNGSLLWMTSSADTKYMSVKTNLISYSPITLNGGMSLKGHYFVDLALFNTNSKYRKSSWITINDYVAIEKEENVSINGCANYLIPDREQNKKRNKFRFGR